MDKLISVIVPIFNREYCLKETIDSILSQTCENFEVLLIDDGSTDNSLAVCNEYAKIDNRIKVFHKQNGGLSDARNYGIEKSTGEYLIFIDSDDTVTPDFFAALTDLIDKSGCKLAMVGHTVVFEDGKVDKVECDNYEVLSAPQAISKIMYHDFWGPAAWGKIYHKSLFDNISFPVGKLYEDIATIPLLIHKASAVAQGKGRYYNYIVHSDSIVNCSYNPRKAELMEMTDFVCDFIDEQYPSLKTATNRRRVHSRFSTLNQMLNVKGYKQEKAQIIDYIKKHRDWIIKNPAAPKTDKIAVYSLMAGYGFYKFVWSLYLKIFK